MAKNMYFDDDYVKNLILNEYLPSLVRDENGTIISCNRVVEQEIVKRILPIVNAIINKYSLWMFMDVEELQNEGIAECWRYLPNFNPDKGSCFNLFSLICKYHLISLTRKDKKNRLTADVDICPEVEARTESDHELFFEQLESELFKIVEDNFKNDKSKYTKYLDIVSILMDYLHKNHMVVGKKDLYSAFKEYGYKNTDYKKFVADIEPFKNNLYELAD